MYDYISNSGIRARLAIFVFFLEFEKYAFAIRVVQAAAPPLVKW
jgi:hypothetical protein